MNSTQTYTSAASDIQAGVFDSIPVIDFGAMAGSDPAEKARVAAEIRQACISVGFFYIINHGIEEAVIEALFDQAKRFFALPIESKLKLRAKDVEHLIGYVSMYEEGKDLTKGDLHEAYDFVTEAQVTPEITVQADFRSASNRWPADLPGFHEALGDYSVRIRILTRQIFNAFALALELEESYFDAITDRPLSLGRILYYPHQTNGDEAQIGNGPHTDHECFTILRQDTDVQALQVCNKDGEWIDAPPLAGSFVVNIGDLMARWTNDLFTSTPHRVINRSGQARYSFPFFIGANPDAVIDVLPSCVSSSTPSKYQPIITSDYVQELIARNLGIETV